ncbi:MAG: RdgB/HAM1 family non-canonical purine NTP pyrophosphatase [Acidobacteriota bacterium]
MNVGTSLLIATRNEGKIRELRELLADLPVQLLRLNDFPEINTVPETGDTFIENASLKASGYARQARVLALADDSGLEVDALGGAPGVFSARYAGEAASDLVRVDRLLAELSKIEAAKRNARFVSVVVIANEEGRILNASTGVCEGHIASAPRGENGFGYDPVFIPLGYDSTFAELTPNVKNRISHRAQALRSARDFLLTLTSPPDGS